MVKKRDKMPRLKYLTSTMNMMVMAALWNEEELEELILMRERMMIQEWHKLLSSSLARPISSPWWSSFLQTMGVDTAVFDRIMLCFKEHYIVLSGPGHSGRPTCLVDKPMALGMLLHYYAGMPSCMEPIIN